MITAQEARNRMQSEAYINHNLDLIQAMVDNAIAVGQCAITYIVPAHPANEVISVLKDKGYEIVVDDNQATKSLYIRW